MCILIHHPVGTEFSREQMQDFYTKNSDGFGAIVKRGGTIDVIKSIGSFEEIDDLYNKHVSGHEAIIHLRMKTHGEIDIANCHPYEVIPGLWLAHNGVLSTGNAADVKMSDTWHYINDYLKPLLQRDPNLIKQPAFQALIADHIGTNNRFGIMGEDGEVIIINRTSGVEHKGVWYSNTYAWSPARFGYYSGGTTIYGSSASRYGYGDYDDDVYGYGSWQVRNRTAYGQVQTAFGKETKKKSKVSKARDWKPLRLNTNQLKNLLRQCYNVMLLNDYDNVVTWVEEHPLAAMNFLYEMYGSENSDQFDAKGISDLVNLDPYGAADLVMQAWEDEEDYLLELADIQFKKEIRNGKHV
jgi:hypothetical protein